MNKELQKLLSQPTASVEEVGRICFGLSRQASYRAAKSGRFPTIDIGSGTQRMRKRVPTAMLRKMLGLEPA